jgi:hypothetical protein
MDRGEAHRRSFDLGTGTAPAFPQDRLNGMYQDLLVLTDAEPEDLLARVCQCGTARVVTSLVAPALGSGGRDAAAVAPSPVASVTESKPEEQLR